MKYRREALGCVEIFKLVTEFAVFPSTKKENSFTCTLLVEINNETRRVTCYFSKKLINIEVFKQDLIVNQPDDKGLYEQKLIKHSPLKLLKGLYLYIFDAQMTNGEYPKRRDGSVVKYNYVLGLKDEYATQRVFNLTPQYKEGQDEI